MKRLSSISEQLVELNLQESKLSDDLASGLKELNSLRILRLDQTSITNKTLEKLKDKEELETLNLFDTGVTKEGITELLNYIEPKKVFFGNIGNQANNIVVNDEQGRQTTISQGLQEGFIEKTKLDKPLLIGEKSIFESEIVPK